MAKNNECVIITGASGKLGQNFSRCLLEIGYDVIGISRSKVNLLEGKTDTAAANSGKFYSLQADLTSPDFCPHIMEELQKLNVNVIALINNARDLNNLRVNKNGRVNRENFQFEHLLNVVVPYELASTLYENYTSLRSVINIGSIYGSVAMNRNLYADAYETAPIHYSVSKAALIHLTKELAMRFADKKVAVNCISFGGVKGRESISFMERYASLSPYGEMLEEKELSHHIVYMINAEFKGMTGQNVIVDGGWTVW